MRHFRNRPVALVSRSLPGRDDLDDLSLFAWEVLRRTAAYEFDADAKIDYRMGLRDQAIEVIRTETPLRPSGLLFRRRSEP